MPQGPGQRRKRGASPALRTGSGGAWRAGSRCLLAVFCLGVISTGLLCTACSEPTRYRVLSFFFDGVPKPGETPTEGYAAPTGTSMGEVGGGVKGQVPHAVTYTHEPFRKDNCGACHHPTSGDLYRTAREGLCAGCHANIPGPARYVHGPVAVNACLFCHHPHGSAYRGVLVAEATTLCLRCHARADLSQGAHHASIDEQSCITCHDPHAGDDRFFLKRSDR